MTLVKWNSIWMMLVNLAYMLPNFIPYVTSGKLNLILLLIVHWVLVITIFIVMGYSIKTDKPHLMKIVANLVLLRYYIPMFDFEERRFNNTYVVLALNAS